ncbi:MAG: hypothetical protein Q8L27_01000 [archaeon]|nr:hypothetical protein [archaeon]
MKIKNLLLSLSIALLLVMSVSFAFADRTVNYPVYYGIVEDDASLTSSTTAITGVNATVYICTNAACTISGAVVTQTYTDTNILSIVFPEVLQSQYGYIVHVTKDGYIGWEQINVIRYGNGTVDSTTPFYISQKRNGYAPIMNLNVEESVPTGMPIRVGFDVSVDADTYAALEGNIVSDIPLNYFIETDVTLEMFNSTGVLYTDSQTVYVPHSGFLPVSFDCPAFNTVGDYGVRVYTDIPASETKILNSIRQTVTANFFVIPQNLRNYTFTLINNLQMSPALARENDSVNFSFTYLSGFVDESGTLFPANTNLNMTIYSGANQIYNNFVSVGNSGSYSFLRSFADSGSYRLVVVGSPNDNRGNLSLPSTQELVFTIGDAINNTIIDPDDGDEDNNPEVSGEDYSKLNFGPSYPLNSGSNETIVLSEPAKSLFSWKAFNWFLIILIIILLIAIAYVYYLKYN